MQMYFAKSFHLDSIREKERKSGREKEIERVGESNNWIKKKIKCVTEKLLKAEELRGRDVQCKQFS